MVNRLADSVTKIKADRNMGDRFMLLEIMMRDEYKKGRQEGRIGIIADFLSNGNSSETAMVQLHATEEEIVAARSIIENSGASVNDVDNKNMVTV